MNKDSASLPRVPHAAQPTIRRGGNGGEGDGGTRTHSAVANQPGLHNLAVRFSPERLKQTLK